MPPHIYAETKQTGLGSAMAFGGDCRDIVAGMDVVVTIMQSKLLNRRRFDMKMKWSIIQVSFSNGSFIIFLLFIFVSLF
jgi:hypothetical protein